MSKIRILTPEELEARHQQLPAETRDQHEASELHSTENEDSSATRQPNRRPGGVSRKHGVGFEQLYPNIAHFVDAIGWIEFGRDDDSPLTSFIRACNMGGMVWEGQDTYNSLDEAFQDLEQGLGAWMNE